MIYGYIRVSTDKQDCENQKLGIEAKAKTLGGGIDKYIEDAGVSGMVKARKRNLWKIIKQGKQGDWLITSELSRLGRSTVDVLETCGILAQKGINVWFVKQNIGLDKSPMGKMMLAIMSAFAEMERDLISMRTKEAMAIRKQKGLTLGRKFGSKNKSYKLDDKKMFIIEELKKGVSKRKLAKKLKVAVPTLNRFLERRRILL